MCWPKCKVTPQFILHICLNEVTVNLIGNTCAFPAMTSENICYDKGMIKLKCAVAGLSRVCVSRCEAKKFGGE